MCTRFTGALLPLLLLSGCGGSSLPATNVPRPDALPAPFALATLTPPEARSFVFIDVHAMRGSPLFEAISESFDIWQAVLEAQRAPAAADEATPDAHDAPRDADPATPEAGDQGETTVLTEALANLDWLYVARDSRSESAEGATALSVLGGELTEAQATQIVLAAAQGTPDLPMSALPFGMGSTPEQDPLGLGVAEPITVEPVRVYGRAGFSAGEHRLVEISERIWLLGSPTQVSDAFERAAQEPSAASTERGRLHERLGLFDHHFVFALEDRDAVRELLVSEEDREEGEIPAWVERLDGVGGRLDLGEGLRFSAVLSTANASDARRTARDALTSLREDSPSETVVQVLGLGPTALAIEPRVDGSLVWLEGEMSARQSDRLWARFGGIVGAGLVAYGVFQDFSREMEENLGAIGAEGIGGAGQLDYTPTGDAFEVDASSPPQFGSGRAGGDVDAGSLDERCVGHVGNVYHPMLVTEETQLRILVHSDQDTVLAVELEDGSWLCSDDFEGLDPGLEATFPVGMHRLYVGSYVEGALASYSIGITRDAATRNVDLPAPPP